NTTFNWIAVQPIQPHTPLFIIINSGKLLLSLKAVLPNLIRSTSTTDCSGLLIPDTDLGENPRRERGV
uniref:hypothetical protein n=1 Tax=Pseudomonas aeruginosa TaxID=287 RepID=UPI001BD5A15F